MGYILYDQYNQCLIFHCKIKYWERVFIDVQIKEPEKRKYFKYFKNIKPENPFISRDEVTLL